MLSRFVRSFAVPLHRSFAAPVLIVAGLASPALAVDYIVATQADFVAASTRTYQPGDRIRLQSGQTFTGQLTLAGSGTAANPIIVEAVGSGALPRIDGGGVAGGAVVLNNGQHWIIRHIAVTNDGTPNSNNFHGIVVNGTTGGTLTGIRIADCRLSNIDGLAIFVQTPASGSNTKFHNVVIENNVITDVRRRGIQVRNYFNVLGNSNPDESKWFTGVVVRNNYIARTGLNGIVVWGATAPLIAYNCLVETANAEYGQGIFNSFTRDAVIEHNEVCYTYYNGVEEDAGGIGIDYQVYNTVVQYNYVHDNDWSGIVVMANHADATHVNEGTIVRYNISERNTNGVSHSRKAEVRISGPAKDCHLYNNVFHSTPGDNGRMIFTNSWGGWPQSVTWRNNIFFHEASGGYTLGGTQTFNNNVYWGNRPSSEPSDANKKTGDPKFVAGGTGGFGLDSVGGYRLMAGSSALGTGTVIANNGGQDYWGSPVPSTNPNIGPYQGAAAPALPDYGLALFAENFNATAPYAVPSGWTPSAPAAGLAGYVDMGFGADPHKRPNASNRAFVIEDASTSGHYHITREFSPVTGAITWLFTFSEQHTAAGDRLRFLLRQGTLQAVHLKTNGTGMFYETPGGSWVSLGQTISAGQWYRVRVTADVAAQTFRVWVNDVLRTASPVAFQQTVTAINRVQFRTWNAGTPVAYIDDVAVYRPTTVLFFHDFESDTVGAAPANWTITAGSGTSALVANAPGGGKALRALDQSSNAVTARRNFTAQSGTFRLSWRVRYASSVNNLHQFNIRDPNSNARAFRFETDGGALKYFNASEQLVTITSLTANTWYTIDVDVDVPNARYSVSVNGNPVNAATDVPFYNAAASIGSFELRTSTSQQGEIFMDDVSLIY